MSLLRKHLGPGVSAEAQHHVWEFRRRLPEHPILAVAMNRDETKIARRDQLHRECCAQLFMYRFDRGLPFHVGVSF